MGRRIWEMYPEPSGGGGKQNPVPLMLFIFILSSDLRTPMAELSGSQNSRSLADLAIKLRGGWVHIEAPIWGSTLSFLVIERSVSLQKALGKPLKLCLKRLVWKERYERIKDQREPWRVRESVRNWMTSESSSRSSWRQVKYLRLAHSLWHHWLCLWNWYLLS